MILTKILLNSVDKGINKIDRKDIECYCFISDIKYIRELLSKATLTLPDTHTFMTRKTTVSSVGTNRSQPELHHKGGAGKKGHQRHHGHAER